MSRDDDLNAAKQEALGKFTETCTALVERIKGISGRVEEELSRLVTRTRRLRNGMRVLYGLTAVVVIAAGALTVVAFRMSDTQHNLQVSDRIQTENALCPLYTVFINADTPQSRELAARSGADLKLRDQAFATIRESYAVLGCSPHLTPEGTIPPAGP